MNYIYRFLFFARKKRRYIIEWNIPGFIFETGKRYFGYLAHGEKIFRYCYVSLSQEHSTQRFGRGSERVCSREKCGKQAWNAECEKYRFKK